MGSVAKVVVYLLSAILFRQVGQGVIGVLEGIGFGLWKVFSIPTLFMCLLVVAITYPIAFSACKNRRWQIWVSGLVASGVATLFIVVVYWQRLGEPTVMLTAIAVLVEWLIVGILAAMCALSLDHVRLRTRTERVYW